MVKLRLPHSIQVHLSFHVSHLKPVSSSPLVPPSRLPPPAWIIAGSPAYSIRHLLDVHHCGRGLQYLVDWEGFASEEHAWVLHTFIVDASLVWNFLHCHPGKFGSPSGSRRERWVLLWSMRLRCCMWLWWACLSIFLATRIFTCTLSVISGNIYTCLAFQLLSDCWFTQWNSDLSVAACLPACLPFKLVTIIYSSPACFPTR